jgi:chaperonin GroES
MASAPAMAANDPQPAGDVQPSPMDKLALLARAEGDISAAFSSDLLTQIGSDVVEDYERDEADREDWRQKVESALKAAAQEESGEKNFPWENAANVKYPLLTTAALQFNARSYPAIIKGDEPVQCKVIGNDNGMPQVDPMTGQPAMQMTPQGPQPVMARPPGYKTARAQRVAQYLSTTLMYRVEGWEEDTDALLLQLPIVGCAFRKVCYVDGQLTVSLVPALNLVAPMKAKDVASSPRLTQVIEDVYPYQIAERMAAGLYRHVELLPESGDDEAPRALLEQHRLMDLDDDGVPEPYIVTVDKVTREVLRLESNFSLNEAMQAGARVKKLSQYFVKYDFFPHPKGCFYGIGFGHLLEPITEVVNTAVNQLIDAGTAQIAGGGFIAGGVRIQGNSSKIKLKPGEFAMVNGVAGSQLKDAIFERTVPEASPVAFQLLDMMLGAAKDIASIKDIVSGDASNMGQVGTTMAMIEQGLQVFSSIYKRVYRSLKAEYEMIFDCLARWGGDNIARDYLNVLDDPQANFQADFAEADFDIRPVSDPGNVTRMQKMARAAFLMQFLGRGLNDMEIYSRIFEAADIEDIQKLFPDPQQVQQQQQVQQAAQGAEIAQKQSDAQKKGADAIHSSQLARKAAAEATQAETETMRMMQGVMTPWGGTWPIGGLSWQQIRKTSAEADKTELEAQALRDSVARGIPPISDDKIITRL